MTAYFFRCSEDSVIGKNFAHRKQWIVDKLSKLAQLYAIEVCAPLILKLLQFFKQTLLESIYTSLLCFCLLWHFE